jgi:hypothetical protein
MMSLSFAFLEHNHSPAPKSFFLSSGQGTFIRPRTASTSYASIDPLSSLAAKRSYLNWRMCWSKIGLLVARRVAKTLQPGNKQAFETFEYERRHTFPLQPKIAGVHKVEHSNSGPVERGSRNWPDCRNSSFRPLQACRSFRVLQGFDWNVCAVGSCWHR